MSDNIRVRPATKEYKEGWDHIFKKKVKLIPANAIKNAIERTKKKNNGS